MTYYKINASENIKIFEKIQVFENKASEMT